MIISAIMMNSPLVSILVPVYNVEKYVRACLDSLISQTYKNIEIVLVDDGSTDDSGTICDEYAAKSERIVVVHKKNEGVAKARITAFEQSHGSLITFVDADDFVDPQYVEKLVAPIINDGCDMVSCDYYKVLDGIINEPRAKITGLYENDEIDNFIADHFFYDKNCRSYGMTIFLCTKMVKREYVLDALKQGIGLWFGEDQISVFNMLINCKKMCLISDRLYYYVQYAGQATKKYDESLWTNIVKLMERYQQFDVNGLYEKGIRMRTWLHITNTIFVKMKRAGITRSDFCSHVSKARKLLYMNDFFRPLHIDFGIKVNLRYWLLKLKCFNLFYYLYLSNIIIKAK